MSGFNYGRRGEGLEGRAGTLSEGAEAPQALGADHRLAASVEHGNLAAGNQEAPVAQAAIIDSRLARREVGVAERPDDKYVSGAGAMRCGCGGYSVAFP